MPAVAMGLPRCMMRGIRGVIHASSGCDVCVARLPALPGEPRRAQEMREADGE